MYPFRTLPVHFHTLIENNRLDPPVNVSTAQHNSLYLHASHSSNHKDLPVITTTCEPTHTCTRSWPYLFIFILSFRLTAKIYPSTFLLRFMSTVVSVHEYTSSVYFLFFGITCAVTFQLIYCGTYTEIFPEINLPVYLHASLSSNHKDLPVTTTTSTRSLLYLLIFIFLFRLTAKIYPLTFLLLYMSTNVPAHQYTFQFICSFSEQLPFNSSNGVSTHGSTRK